MLRMEPVIFSESKVNCKLSFKAGEGSLFEDSVDHGHGILELSCWFRPQSIRQSFSGVTVVRVISTT
jgi:hypothetical protein